MRLIDGIDMFKQHAYDRLVPPIDSVYVEVDATCAKYSIVVNTEDLYVVSKIKVQFLRLFEGKNAKIECTTKSSFCKRYGMYRLYPTEEE